MVNLTFTTSDLITIIVSSTEFKQALHNAVRGEIMPLLTDIEALKGALAAQGVKVSEEFEQVKAKFIALKGEIGTLTASVEALTTKVAELENIDLTAEIAAVTDSLAKIDAISESDVPVEPTV